MANYNLNQLRILWEIATDGLKQDIYHPTNTSTPMAGDFKIQNAKTDIVEQVYRTRKGVDNTTKCYIQMDCGSPDLNLYESLTNKAVVVDTFALLNHNFSKDASITLYGYGDSNAQAPSTVDQFISLCNGTSGKKIFTAKPEDDHSKENNFIWVSPTEITSSFRYYLIEIQDLKNEYGYIQIGRILGGQATVFTEEENITSEFTYQEVSYKDVVEVNGFTSVANARSMKKKMGVELRNINAIPVREGSLSGHNYRNLKRYMRYCRDTLKALVIPDSRIPYAFHIYAKMTEVPQESFNFLDFDALYVTMNISWDEAK